MDIPVGTNVERRQVVKAMATGSTLEALGGAAAVVLAILGLARIAPNYMLPIAGIVIGATLLAQGGLSTAEASRLVSGADTTQKVEVEGGFGAEGLAGAAAIVLGILALISIDPLVLMSVSAIVLGAGLLLEGAGVAAMARTAVIDETMSGAHTTHNVMAGSAGAQVLVGLAAIVLGILALVGLNSIVLDLVAMLAIGAGMLLSGAALGGRMVKVAAR
ncbi:MAG TPA: hypothetical protein VFB54_13990 [Burkholderiales bacterium]|nr:hypothetical protein [Burkholderiales bacterium]